MARHLVSYAHRRTPCFALRAAHRTKSGDLLLPCLACPGAELSSVPKMGQTLAQQGGQPQPRRVSRFRNPRGTLIDLTHIPHAGEAEAPGEPLLLLTYHDSALSAFNIEGGGGAQVGSLMLVAQQGFHILPF
jgi:hypothetical protein